MIIDTHRDIVPSFGIGRDQDPVAIFTVLCVGRSGRDCAAYRGAVPMSKLTGGDPIDYLERIRSHGDKVSEATAREMFGEFEHGGQALTYRR